MDDELLQQPLQDAGDLPPSEEQDEEEEESPRRFLRALLVWLPLLACAACLVFTTVQPALFNPSIPVTGRDPLAPPTPSPGESPFPAPDHPAPAVPGLPYREEALLRLNMCTDSFHAFFMIEQTAIHQPDLANASGWQEDAARTVEGFREDCQPLGAISTVPTAYEDVDRWLKLAAAEVAPAADSFSAMLDSASASHQDDALDHLLRFMEYTRKAQDLMERLDRRKQI